MCSSDLNFKNFISTSKSDLVNATGLSKCGVLATSRHHSPPKLMSLHFFRSGRERCGPLSQRPFLNIFRRTNFPVERNIQRPRFTCRHTFALSLRRSRPTIVCASWDPNGRVNPDMHLACRNKQIWPLQGVAMCLTGGCCSIWVGDFEHVPCGSFIDRPDSEPAGLGAGDPLE